jgi:hypothetical protein
MSRRLDSIITIKSTPRRREIYDLFIEGLIQADIARILDISEEAVRKQKDKLVKAKVLKEIGTSGVYERGSKARFFEYAKPIQAKITEDFDAGSDDSQPSQPVDRPAVSSPPKPSTPPGAPASVRLEEYDIETLEAHMHGHIIFPVATVGSRHEIVMRRPGEEPVSVPLFTAPGDLGGDFGYRNNWRWTCELSIPGWDYPIKLQLRVTPNICNLHVYPPRIHLSAQDIDGKTHEQLYPVRFFDKEVFGVLDFLERFGGWKFDRIHGSRVGRMCGQVYFAYSNPELTRHLPPNLQGFADFPDALIDHSKGDPEIEFNQAKISNARFLLTAKESHYELREELEDIEARISAEEAELAELRLKVTSRLKETWSALDEVTEAQSRTMEYQRLEMQRRGPTGQSLRDPAIAAIDDDDGGMYR